MQFREDQLVCPLCEKHVLLEKHVEDKGQLLQQFGFECPGCGYYPRVNKWLLAQFVKAQEVEVHNKFCGEIKKSIDSGQIKVRRPKRSRRK